MADPSGEEVRAALQLVAAEFGLGDLHEVKSLTGGSVVPYRIVTPAGAFVLKRGVEREVAFYAEVERRLNAAGVRQARVLARADGEHLSSTGWWVQEWIAGEWTVRPTPAQSLAFTRYLAAYHRVLEHVPVPAWIDTEDDAWRRADSLSYVLDRLPAAAGRLSLLPATREAFDAGCRYVRVERARLEALPRQLVDGDAGSENVLYTGDDTDPAPVMIDFTPYRSNHLQGLVVAQYWHHLYFADDPIAIDRIADELRAYGAAHPLTIAEREAFPAIVARIALRNLSQELTHRELGSGTVTETDSRRRAACMHAVLDHRAELAAIAADA